MLRRPRTLSSAYDVPETDLNDLVRRIRRLILHKGFDRARIDSPLLKRLTPSRELFANMVEADIRKRIEDADLDAKAVSYLLQSAEAELDRARLRLT